MKQERVSILLSNLKLYAFFYKKKQRETPQRARLGEAFVSKKEKKMLQRPRDLYSTSSKVISTQKNAFGKTCLCASTIIFKMIYIIRFETISKVKFYNKLPKASENKLTIITSGATRNSKR